MSLEALRLLLGPGRLKVYLGYAIGVGKTHRALLELQELKRRGVDVAIGWLEPKDRPLLERLAGGLPLIPPKRQGVYELMDLEALLARRPSTVLVDELARRNPPGHPKRHEEVTKLLEAGISVITTLNAYHLESLAGAAEAYLRHPVEERVPDSLLEQADEVVVVDLPPEDLLERLRGLPAYRGLHSPLLSLPTLKALREMALRRVARSLEPGLERLLVLVPEDYYWFRRLVDYAALRARRLGGMFYVLHPRPQPLLGAAPPLEEERRARMEAYVAERGGTFLVRSGPLIPVTLEALRAVRAQALLTGHGGSRPWPPPTQLKALLRRLERQGVEVHLVPETSPRRRRSPQSAPREGKGPGRLKVFLGMAPGVGKTYAMLQEAHELKAKGVDVVVGLVETHGRKETEALLEGLEVLPRKPVVYKGVTLLELDLMALLQRHPQVALVDELAHTNPPGLLHAKRYQDVLTLTRAGIAVHTTLNVQHLETLAHLVERVTGIRVRETVPDWVVAEADEVVLVDLPPEALRARLAEGKVYPPEKAEEALKGFFTQENLRALRELALAEVSGLAAEPPAPLGPVLVYGDSEQVFLRAARVADHLGEALYLLTEGAPENLLQLAHAHRAKVKVLGPLGPAERLAALEAYVRRLAPGLVVLPLGPLAQEATGRLPQTLLLVPPEDLASGRKGARRLWPWASPRPASPAGRLGGAGPLR
ncbi:histidine kinase [Thermus sp. FJN-A]